MDVQTVKSKYRTTFEENEEPLKYEYMKYHIQLCEGFAMWPLDGTETPFRKFSHHLTVFIGTLLCLLLLIPLTLKMIWDFQNWDGIATVIDFATVVASGTFRYIYVYVRSAKYYQLIASMYDKFIYQSFYPKDKPLTMDRYIKIGSLVGAVYVTGAFLWIFQMCFGPLVAYLLDEGSHESIGNATNVSMNAPHLPLVFEGAYPFDISKQPNHGLVYAFQVAGWLSVAYIYLVIDAFWYMVLAITIGQLILIKHSFHNLKSLVENEKIMGDITGEQEREALKEFQKGMNKCINQHSLIREFIHEVENLLCPNVLIDFLHAIISISFIMLDMTIAINKSYWMKTFYLLEYLMVSIIHMFLYDYFGHELVVQEEELAFALYDTPWYLCSKQVKKGMILSMINARNPYRLTGGKMYNMCLEFFVATQKLVFSYFMVLLQLRNGD